MQNIQCLAAGADLVDSRHALAAIFGNGGTAVHGSREILRL